MTGSESGAGGPPRPASSRLSPGPVAVMERPGGSLEGWVPEIGAACPLSRVVELAFDYRGNTTVVKTNGTEIEGYIFNRNAEVPQPFVQLFDAAGDGPITIPYAEIRTIRFTGKDTAAGNSYEAWLRNREQDKARSGTGSRE